MQDAREYGRDLRLNAARRYLLGEESLRGEGVLQDREAGQCAAWRGGEEAAICERIKG